MNSIRWWLAMACVSFTCACNKGPINCVLEISLEDAGNDVSSPPVPGMEAVFSQQLLVGGVLTGAFATVAESTTDAQGKCTLQFKKENALVYRLDLEADQWFSRQIEFNPDDFLPADTVHFDEKMMPRATLNIWLEASALAGPEDVLEFRTLHVPGEYPTCTNIWRSFNFDSAQDTSWTCDMEGGANVAYAWKITRDGETTEYLDSLIAVRFAETTLHLVW